jgi:hypothetical protein
VRIPLPKGMGTIIHECSSYKAEQGRELAAAAFELDFKDALRQSEAVATGNLLWNLLALDGNGTRAWIRGAGEEEWFSKAAASSLSECGSLLWTLYHADEDMARAVARRMADQMLRTLASLELEHIPLLGFFAFCGTSFNLSLPLPPISAIAEKAAKSFSLSKIGSCICLLRKQNPSLANEFCERLRRSRFGRIAEAEESEALLPEHPFPSTVPFLAETHRLVMGSNEPLYTFSKMISMSRTYLTQREISKTSLARLRAHLLEHPTGSPLFVDREQCNFWLEQAIDFGIYVVRLIPHRKNPVWNIRLLSLNPKNPLVMSSIHHKQNE